MFHTMATFKTKNTEHLTKFMEYQKSQSIDKSEQST